MQAWAWSGRDAQGGNVSGRLDAGSDAEVVQQLKSRGVVPVQVAPASAQGDDTGGPLAWLRRAPVGPLDLLVLTRQMFTLQRAGVPILRAFAGLQASTTNAALVRVLDELRDSLSQGRDLASAMARHPRVFDGFFVSMIRVGELTGRLTEALQRLAEHIEFEMDLKARVKAALRYPATVMVAIGAALLVVNLFVIPAFANVFAGFKAQLPPVTRALLAVSHFTVNSWPWLLAGVGGIVWAWRSWLATPRGRLAWDRTRLKLPIVGPLTQKATIGRFVRSFALASKSGVPIGNALAVAAQTADNVYVSQRINFMRAGIERGESVLRCAQASGIFTPMVLQMIAVGEETGELDTLLEEAAAVYARETDYAIKGLSASIEPILLTVVGALVLVLALGVFLPLWDLGGAARNSR